MWMGVSTTTRVAPQAHRAQAAILNEGSCCRTATSTWPSMPTLKNKKICEDVPPQLDLAPRPSFDSAHLDVPSDEFPVYLLQNGVKMINEPPRLLRSYSNLSGIRLLFTLRYDLYDATLSLWSIDHRRIKTLHTSCGVLGAVCRSSLLS